MLCLDVQLKSQENEQYEEIERVLQKVESRQ